MSTVMCWSVAGFVAAGWLVLIAPTWLPAAAGEHLVKLAHPAADFAVNPTTGALAAVLPERNEVVVLPKLAGRATADGAVAVEVGRRPVAVLFKQLPKASYLVIACEDANELAVVEAGTYKLVKRIPVAVPGPSYLSASRNPDDPHVYYCGTGDANPFQMARLGRVNLAALKDQEPLAGGNLWATEAAVSADGSLVYLRNRNVSPSGYAIYSLAGAGGDAPKLEPVFSKHESSESYVTDPFGEFVLTGQLDLIAELLRGENDS